MARGLIDQEAVLDFERDWVGLSYEQPRNRFIRQRSPDVTFYDAVAAATPIVDSDTNGATTESAVADPALVSSSDSGLGSEASALVTQIPASDANGATTESAAPRYLATSTDSNGATTESAAFSYLAAGTDTGLGSETGTASVPISGSDSGSDAEVGSNDFGLLGNNATGAQNREIANGSKYAGRWILLDDGWLDNVSINVDGLGSGVGDQIVRVVVYADNHGLPTTLVAQSEDFTITDGQARNWVKIHLVPVAVRLGYYWLGIAGVGGASLTGRYYSDSNSGAGASSPSGITDPFGAATVTNEDVTVYSDYRTTKFPNIPQKAGSDSGTSTESAVVTAVIAATADAGVGSQTATYLYSLSGSDVNGVTTELAARSAVIASADTGSGSEAATVSVPIAASDNGSGSETATMLFLASGSDFGTSTEDVYFVKRQGFIDTGTATENTALVAQIPGSDSGTGSESGSVNVGGVSVSGTDSGNGYDRVGAVAAVIDNFNRANGSLGAGWTPITTDGGLTIAGNEVASTAALHLGNYRNAESYSDDQYAEVEVTSTPLASGDFIGAMVRAKNGGRDFYTVFYAALPGDGGVGSENLYLYKRVNDGFAGAGGGFLSLGQTKVQIGTLSPGDKIRIEATGPLIKGYVNGVLILSGVDFDHLSGGAPGVFAFGFSHLDNFKGGDLEPISAAATVTDDFNRANGANFGGSAKWKTANIAPSVTSNKIAGQASTTVGGAWVGIFNADQASQITGMTIPGGAWVGVSVRDMAPAPQQYLAIAYNAGPPVVNLYKQNGLGSYTQLGSSYTIPGGTISGSDVLRIEATGSTITAKYNGVTAVSVTDTFIPAGGAPGLAIFDTASADNWQGEHSPVSIADLAAAIPATDNNGATTEASTLLASLTVSDVNGATTESGSVAVGTTFKTDSDNGAGTEIAARSAVLTGTDTGAGSEAAALQAVLTGADNNATWVESALSSAFKADSDSGTSVENATYLFLTTGSDSGIGADMLSSIGVKGTDASSAGTDAGSRQGFYAVTDAGSGSDLSSLVAALTGADSGSGTDSAGVLGGQVFLTGLDTGAGAEIVTAFAKASIDAGIGADLLTQFAKTGTDASGLSVENAVRSALISALDTGAGTELVTAFAKAVADSGSGVDIVSLIARAVTDAGTGTEASQVASAYFVTDQGVSVDVESLRAFLISLDTGAGADLGILGAFTNRFDYDFGHGTDNGLAYEHIERFVQELLSAIGQKPTLVSAGTKNGHVMTTTAQKPRLTSAGEESGRIVTTTIEKPKLLSGR